MRNTKKWQTIKEKKRTIKKEENNTSTNTPFRIIGGTKIGNKKHVTNWNQNIPSSFLRTPHREVHKLLTLGCIQQELA